jgi:hypothetical protein
MVVGAKVRETFPSPDVFPPGVKAHERYFYDFMSYLVAAVGFAHAVDSVHGAVSTFQPTDTVRFSCKQSPAQWYWAPAALLGRLALKMDSEEIYLRRFDAPAPPPDATLELGALTMLFQTFAQALLTNYFERYKADIRRQYGSASEWPAVWNFARVVRNAMAHGGRISIIRADDPISTWKGLTYTIADNERDILLRDLWPGDLFDLIQEMDEALQTAS